MLLNSIEYVIWIIILYVLYKDNQNFCFVISFNRKGLVHCFFESVPHWNALDDLSHFLANVLVSQSLCVPMSRWAASYLETKSRWLDNPWLQEDLIPWRHLASWWSVTQDVPIKLSVVLLKFCMNTITSKSRVYYK